MDHSYRYERLSVKHPDIRPIITRLLNAIIMLSGSGQAAKQPRLEIGSNG